MLRYRQVKKLTQSHSQEAATQGSKPASLAPAPQTQPLSHFGPITSIILKCLLHMSTIKPPVWVRHAGDASKSLYKGVVHWPVGFCLFLCKHFIQSPKQGGLWVPAMQPNTATTVWAQVPRSAHQGWGLCRSFSHFCPEQTQRQPKGNLWGARSQPSQKLFVEGYQETVGWREDK